MNGYDDVEFARPTASTAGSPSRPSERRPDQRKAGAPAPHELADRRCGSRSNHQPSWEAQ